KDEGIGIPADELDKIFEPFIRGKAVDSIQGTGLGLSIVKKAVDLLQGTIEVESRPRRGSIFKVTLPRQIAFM
ncbi:MAG TPA: sensor histidine kinase, partial [Chryseosolibacter sp.]|nr:sensor histidine kinase [Chryseosolibacter sp.]